MKPITAVILFVTALTGCLAQENTNLNDAIQELEQDTTVISQLNNYKWRFDIAVGESRGISPYSTNYSSTDSQKKFGYLQVNSYTMAVNYTYNKLLGFKVGLGFDRFKEKEDKSDPFETAQYRLGLEAVLDLNALIKFNADDSRFKLLFHSGLLLSSFQEITSEENPIAGRRELNGGIIIGITPMYRFSKKGYVFMDFNSVHNFRQHYTWDGAYTTPSQNLYGHMINASLGLSLSFGKVLEWRSDNKQILQLEDKNKVLEKRIDELETQMNDTDKDGVLDFLDNENNSIAGVTVDTRGVMVDFNKNGVPDEIERYLEKRYSTDKQNDVSTKTTDAESLNYFTKAIEDEYVSVLFDVNKSTPGAASYDAIYFVLNFLNKNPQVKLSIIGYADAQGSEEYNKKLAMERANGIKEIFVKSGIDANRLKTVCGGIDESVDVTALKARKLVRRVVFKVSD